MSEITEKKEERLTISKKDGFMYAFGGMFCSGPCSNFINYFFLFFMTDVAGFPTLIAATCYTIADTVKAIHMMISGVVIDSTNLKWGKYRSWFIICMFCTALLPGAIFLPYNFSNYAIYAVVITTIQCLATFSYNLNWTSHRSLVGIMSGNSKDNVTLVSWANAAAMASGFLYATVNATLLNTWASAGKFQYAFTEYTWALLTVIGALCLIKVSGKYNSVAQKAQSATGNANRVGLLEMLKTLKGPGFVYFIAGIIHNVPSGFFYALLAYFTTYVLQDPAAMGYAVMVNYAGGIIGAFLTPLYSKHWERKKLMVFGCVCQSILYFSMFFLGRTGFGFLAIRLLIGIMNQPGSIAITAMANDLGDYYEMRGESRARSFVQAVMGTTIRIGTLISSAISSFGLAALGYQAGVEMTQQLINNICWLMAIAPSIVCICAGLIFWFFYKVDEKELDAYRIKRAEALEK